MAQPAELAWVHAVGDAPPAAHALLTEHYTVRPIEAFALAGSSVDQSPTPTGSDRQGVRTEAPVDRPTGMAGVWASGAACGAALEWAAGQGERVAALVLEAPTSAPDPDVLPRISAPTLVVYGTDDPNALYGRQFRAALPNGHLVFVYAAGPYPADERPQAFVSLLTDFLSRHERFIVSDRSGLLHP